MLLALIAGLVQGAATPDTLTLTRAVEQAVRVRGRVTSIHATVDRARAEARRGSAVPNPVLQFESADLSPTRTAQVTQPLWWLPGWSSMRAAGSAGVRSAAADSVWTMAALARDVRVAVFTLAAMEETRRLMREQAGAADTLLRLAERRLSLGDISELERDQVAQEVATVRLLEQGAMADARVARIGLGRAIGVNLAPNTVVIARLDDRLVDATASMWTAASPGDVGDVPLVASAVEDSAAAANRLSAARWRRLPIPALLGKWEWGGGPGAPTNAIVGFSMPLPIWQFGQHEVAAARADAAERGGAAFEARLEGVRRIEEGRVRFEETAGRAVEARDRLYPTARRLREGAVRLFESGRTGILPVFEAFRREREAAMTMVRELLAYQVARADLVALLGREP